MPHGAVRLADGVNVNRTPTLNEVALSASQLIRYQWDTSGLVLAQKLGGWTRFYPQTLPAPVRALAAWEDINDVPHLAYGTQNITSSAQLGVITNGVNQNITPTSTTDDPPPAASTTEGSPVVTVTDAITTGITSFDSVYIETHIAVGGLILYGLYACTELGATSYQITVTDILGNPLPAPATSSAAVVAHFATTSGSNVVTVVLPNHGYGVGSTYPVLVQTTIGGVTLFGNYLVDTVIDTNTFTILAAQQATATTSGYINGGNAQFIYSFGLGAVPPGTGYGIGGYGLGGYGTGTAITPAVGTPIAATDWTLGNFGEVLIACPINGTLFQPLYFWDPLAGEPIATVIDGAPPLNDGFFIAMPQRQIVVWGTTETGIQDPLLVRWCDVNNFNQWHDLVINQAGQFRLTTGSKIVGGIQGPQQGLLWTDIGLWSMNYLGPPFVYGFNEVGTGCGLISRKAAASLNGVVFWMGPTQFYALNSEGVVPIPCPLWDVIFQDLDTTNLSKIRVAVNSRFNEIEWFYPTLSSGGEVNAYVKYNAAIGFWDYGLLARSAWVDQNVLGPPIGADPNALLLYQHETSNDADGQAMLPSLQTGYFALAEGDFKTFVDQVWPDMRWGDFGGAQSATVKLTFYATDYPGDPPTVFGPYSLTQATQYISPRIRTRLLSIGLSSDDLGSFWRIGLPRYRYQPDGRY